MECLKNWADDMRKALEWLHENFRVIALLAFSLLALAIPVGARLPGVRDWLADPNISAQACLVMVALLSIFLISERRDLKLRLSDISSAFEIRPQLLIASVNGVELRLFKDSTEQLRYVAERIESAKHSVCDLSWVARRPRYRDRPDRIAAGKAYHAAIKEACKRIEYREIFIFNRMDRVEVMQTRLAEKAPLYSCRFFEDDKIPRLQFLIVDKEEVILFGSYGEDVESRCAIRQRDICGAFLHYYNEVWDAADVLKEGSFIDAKKKGDIVKRWRAVRASAK